MAKLNITPMSSKGQIVISSEMRAGKQLILKSVKDFDENIQEDLEFARRTEEAWKSYERGEFKSMSADEFLNELERC